MLEIHLIQSYFMFADTGSRVCAISEISYRKYQTENRKKNCTAFSMKQRVITKKVTNIYLIKRRQIDRLPNHCHVIR